MTYSFQFYFSPDTSWLSFNVPTYTKYCSAVSTAYLYLQERKYLSAAGWSQLTQELLEGAVCVLSFRIRALGWMAGECICYTSLPVAVWLTQLVRTAWDLFQLRLQNPDDSSPLSVRTRCYHLRFCDSAPWWRCLSWLAWRRELSLRRRKRTFLTLLKISKFNS